MMYPIKPTMMRMGMMMSATQPVLTPGGHAEAAAHDEHTADAHVGDGPSI
jgi:hypothetical protein